MGIDVEALKARADLVAIVGSYVALKKRGAEFLGCCPFHADTHPSFYVIPLKKFCTCFSCGWSGDVLDFIQEKEGVDFKEAVARISNGHDWTPKPITQSAAPLPDRVTSKPPANVAGPRMDIRGLGPPVKTWEYKDAEGGLLGYVARYEIEGEAGAARKEIRCWTWGARGTAAPAWACGHWSKPRPLYGLDRAAALPEHPALIVEGEKAADAAQALLPGYVVLTWPGGAQAWKHADWAPLRGRRVDLWPDNDSPGRAAMAGIAGILADPRGLACHGKLIDPRDTPEGFDAADWSPDMGDVMEWLRARATEYAAPQQPSTAPQDGAVAGNNPPPDSSPPAGAGHDTDDAPPLEAYASERGAAPRKQRKKPRLAAVDGNLARAPAPDVEPLPQDMSEDALAEHFVLQHGENWRFVKPWAAWFEWDGDGWRRDETAKIDRLAVQTTRQALYWPEAAGLTAKERRMVNKRSTAGAVRDLAGTDRRIAATVEQWDADSWLLGVPGGVYDLKTCKLLQAEQEQYITKRCAVAPEHGKPALWLEYLDRCHMGNEEVIAYLRRFAGYACTGETGEHALAFLYGTGRNGKGVFLETISRILGDYAKTAGINTFLEQRNPAHSTELARLHKARLVITEEAGAGGRWNESRIKHMTGGGKITARFMRLDDFEFTPNFKLMVAANHKPSLRSVDVAIKSRIHLVPFLVTIPEDERDPYLLDKLREEWPQILGWMLDGCTEWQERGLTPPQKIRDATKQYMEDEDIIADWIAECCDTEGELDGASGYQSYKRWCEAQGHSAWSRIGWSKALMDRGTFDSRRSNGRTIFLGLSLKIGQSVPQ